MTQTVEDDIASVLEREDPTYPCVAQFHNETPAGWNVHIIAIGADFFYDDGTSVQVGPVQVDIAGPNGMVPLNSPNPKKCVVKVFGAIMVKAPGQNPQPFSKTNQAQPGQCMLLTHFILAPKATVDKKDHAARLDPAQVLSLEEK